jgi:hypothetical protein
MQPHEEKIRIEHVCQQANEIKSQWKTAKKKNPEQRFSSEPNQIALE